MRSPQGNPTVYYETPRSLLRGIPETSEDNATSDDEDGEDFDLQSLLAPAAPAPVAAPAPQSLDDLLFESLAPAREKEFKKSTTKKLQDHRITGDERKELELRRLRLASRCGWRTIRAGEVRVLSARRR